MKTRRVVLVAGVLLAATSAFVLARVLTTRDANGPAGEISSPVVPGGPLSVTVILSTNAVTAGKEIPAKFRVTNVSDVPQVFRVMNCSWFDHWQSNNYNIGITGWNCTKNLAVTETLAPGGTYERSAPLYIRSETPTGPQKFKLGFKPMGAAHMVWSGEMTVSVKWGIR